MQWQVQERQGCCVCCCSIVSLLGVSAPQQASFFSTWTLLLVRLG